MSVMQSGWMLLLATLGLAIAIGVPVWLRVRGMAMDLDRRYQGSPWFGSRRTAELELLIDLPPSFRLVTTPDALIVDSEANASTIPWSEVTGIAVDANGRPPVMLLAMGDRTIPFRIERGRLSPGEIAERFTRALARGLIAR